MSCCPIELVCELWGAQGWSMAWAQPLLHQPYPFLGEHGGLCSSCSTLGCAQHHSDAENGWAVTLGCLTAAPRAPLPLVLLMSDVPLGTLPIPVG